MHVFASLYVCMQVWRARMTVDNESQRKGDSDRKTDTGCGRETVKETGRKKNGGAQ